MATIRQLCDVIGQALDVCDAGRWAEELTRERNRFARDVMQDIRAQGRASRRSATAP